MEPPVDPHERHEATSHPEDVAELGGVSGVGGIERVGSQTRACWERFHDDLDTTVDGAGDGTVIELHEVGSDWRMGISVGWPGVDGPGTFAYHLQLGSDLDGELGPWALTRYCRSVGFEATKVAGEVATLGLESDPSGVSNPSMIASGPVGHLEVADMAVEAVRNAFGVDDPSRLQVTVRTGSPPRQPTAAEANSSGCGERPDWAKSIGFDSEPDVSPDGHEVVGWVDNVLVEVTRDADSLPGLELTVARARLTDPNCVPLTVPSGNAASFMTWLRDSGGNGITVETVTSTGRLTHAWATRMLCSDTAPAPALGRIKALDGAGQADPASEAVDAVLGFVREARRNHPDAMRPTRVILRMDI
ncbi:MAG: hypothetical protein GY812_01760 [Actinomycetia bacterium]|nr:hypothetical protein [Actinomycetes bacterium]